MSLCDLVIGLGSPHGDDAVGWQVVERLREKFERSVTLRTIREPLQLLDFMNPAARFWILDACQSGAPVGTVHRFHWPSDQLENVRSTSTHATSLAMALQLAEVLGKLPAQITILAVEVDSCSRVETELCPAVRAAATRLESLLIHELNLARTSPHVRR